MKTAYFLGAGASAADGLPVTSELNFGVAAWLQDNKGRAKRSLCAFYKDLYNVSPEDIERAANHWNKFLERKGRLPPSCGLPNLVETLSLIDVCLAEEQSLGMSSIRRKDARKFLVEMNSTFLRLVRRQLTLAVATAVHDAVLEREAPLTDQFVRSLDAEDTLISTNWDMLLDRCLVEAWMQESGERKLLAPPIRYHCVGELPVNRPGRSFPRTADTQRTLLRLHGALNWFGCASCGNVYVNLEGDYVMDEERPREEYDECDCGAGLLNVMITPSYLKDYRNVSVRSVWREAQKQLELADRWVFIGYSLPPDDFHIRAMLLRALRSQATRKTQPDIKVFLAKGARDAGERYKDLLRISSRDIKMTGFKGWLAQQKNRFRPSDRFSDRAPSFREKPAPAHHHRAQTRLSR